MPGAVHNGEDTMNTSTADERSLWFLDTHVLIRLSYTDGTDDISILESHAPFGDSAPLHVHRNEDEVFHILEGRMRFRVKDQERHAGAGEILIVPKGTPHTYRVESTQGARWLTITTGQEFERFVRAMGRPAQGEGLPPHLGPPSPEDEEALAQVA